MHTVLDHVEEIERLLGIASKTVYRTTTGNPQSLLLQAHTHAVARNLTESSRLIKEATRIMFE